ncbi:uncharacterized protein [Cicer arietinum]|uniref:LOB domain-containing protein 12-like n=1 Tax=Cicer arietinum TaxID=3827 RepID=A0A1S2YIR3_CICAR|nr:LOB domain-containing protein 12-like [Cicer arietinum]
MAKRNKPWNGSNTSNPACAACRHQRRKCTQDCVLAPYFPIDKIHVYESVHKVFGFSNVAKMLTKLDQQGRKQAIKSFEWEAMMWAQNPVFGPFGAYNEALNIITQLLTLLQQQQTFSTSEPKFRGQAHDSLLFSNEALQVSNNVNWAPFVDNNNVVQNNPSFSYPYVHSFEGDLHNVEPKIFNCVPDANVFLHQKSAILQPNYFQNIASVSGSNNNVVTSSTIDQQSQVRDFQCYDGNVENIYKTKGYGREYAAVVQKSEKSIVDHTMAQNRARSKIEEFQHPIYYSVGNSRPKQE